MNSQELNDNILVALRNSIEAGIFDETTKELAISWLKYNGTDYAPVVVVMSIYPEKFKGQSIEQVEAKLQAFSA